MNLNILMTVLNILILAGTLFIAFWAYKSQRTHNFNSVKPILQLDFGDYEDSIFVDLYNNGVGPGIITKIKVTNSNGHIENDLIAYFKDLPWACNAFTTRLEGYAISPNCEICLFETENRDKHKAEIRNILKDLHIEVEYIDIYNRHMKPLSEYLDWFKSDPYIRKISAGKKRNNRQ